jgi:cysteine desulfurase
MHLSDPVYLDHNATTPLAPEALDALLPFLRGDFGNSSSPHRMGVDAARAVESARIDVADLLGCAPDRVVLTGGGTESIATAIAAGRRLQPGRRRFVHSAVEHPASSAPIRRYAEEDGLEARVVGVDANGLLRRDEMLAAIDGDTALVSLLWGNNETGVIQPRELIVEIANACRAAGVLLHLDAVQMAGKAVIDAEDLGVDLLSISGHKFHGPKGTGALYVRDDERFAPLLMGGSHEGLRRAGTVNTAGVVGLGVAARLALDHLLDAFTMAAMGARRDRLENALVERIPGVTVNGASALRTPNTANVSFGGVHGNALLTLLSERNVFVSTGSACGSNKRKPSPVLLAMGVDEELAGGSLRLSIARTTTDVEIERAIDVITSSVEQLRALAPSA